MPAASNRRAGGRKFLTTVGATAGATGASPANSARDGAVKPARADCFDVVTACLQVVSCVHSGSHDAAVLAIPVVDAGTDACGEQLYSWEKEVLDHSQSNSGCTRSESSKQRA